MDPETLKQSGRFYRCLIFQLIWLALIIAIAATGITQTSPMAKIFLKYFAFAYALFLLFILIYFPFVKKICINELMNYMAETTKPLPFFAKRSFEQNMKLGRIFVYCCLAIFAIINYFMNLISWNTLVSLIVIFVISDLVLYFVGLYRYLKNKIKR